MDYKGAGVDVEAGRDFVRRISDTVASTQRPEVLGTLGGFSGCCQIPAGYREPVLVSGTDGVGTKLKLAHQLNQHHSVGVDLVAMCANDVLTSGAEPLFFLDYLATSQLDPAQLASVVEGVATGCRQAGCALLGGETAEMPGFYQPGEYDLAGFCVGVVEKADLIDGQSCAAGDAVIGLASSGIHSNGFSLVRQIVQQGTHPDGSTGYDLAAPLPALGVPPLGEVLLTPTRIYAQPVLQSRAEGLPVRAMAHITGGGLPENLPRGLPPGLAIAVHKGSWPVPPVFDWLATAGQVSYRDMVHTFNLGIGFALVVPASEANRAVQWFTQHQLPAFVIGELVAGEGGVTGLPT